MSVDLSLLPDGGVGWLDASGAHADIVLSTRIRLAKPQDVIAVAEMSDGQVLMTKSWVEVEIDGCA